MDALTVLLRDEGLLLALLPGGVSQAVLGKASAWPGTLGLSTELLVPAAARSAMGSASRTVRVPVLIVDVNENVVNYLVEESETEEFRFLDERGREYEQKMAVRKMCDLLNDPSPEPERKIPKARSVLRLNCKRLLEGGSNNERRTQLL